MSMWNDIGNETIEETCVNGKYRLMELFFIGVVVIVKYAQQCLK